MSEAVFRLRISFQKCGRLCFLSHLELMRALERVVRRARLPYTVSNGADVRMRCSPSPALPVGTSGLDERFDVWLTEYLEPSAACKQLRQASVEGLKICAASYIDPHAKGLQATHTREVYELVLLRGEPADALPGAAELVRRLRRLIEGGSLTVARKDKRRSYDLTQAVERLPEARETADGLLVTLWLRVTEQGPLRPEALLTAALDGLDGWSLRSVTRTCLREDEDGEG
jgi:radical SAM-linked protein